jgi:hypothetical protein
LITPLDGALFKNSETPVYTSFWEINDDNSYQWSGYRIHLGVRNSETLPNGKKNYDLSWVGYNGVLFEQEHAEKRWAEVQDEVKQQLYTQLFGTVQAPVFGKCL